MAGRLLVRVARAARAGFLYGSLVYAPALALAHVVHNRLASAWDATVLLVGCILLYGGWAAATFFVVAVLVVLTRGLARSFGWMDIPRRHPEAVYGRLLGAGLFVFNLLYWIAAFEYGITYDNTLFGKVGSLAAMLAALAVEALLVAAGVVAATLLLLALWRRLRPGWRGAAAGYVAALLACTGAAIGYGVAAGHVRAPAGSDPIEVADTGLRVVVVGLDGADWRVIRPLEEKGELPGFAELERRGGSGPLATIKDSNSAVIWASIYSGLPPERHGVLDFYRIALPGMRGPGVYPVHRTYFKELVDLVAPLGLARRHTADRFALDGVPLWEIADHAGLQIGVTDGYYYSFPAYQAETPGGFVVSYGLDSFFARLAAGGGGASLEDLDLFVQPPELFRRVKPFLGRGDFDWQSAALLDLVSDRPWPRLVNLYSHQPDSFQHWYWKWLQPELFPFVDPATLAANRDKIPALYRDFDGFLARLLAAVGPQTVVIVLSDHGHAPTILHSTYYSQHRHGPPGILLMAGGPVLPGHAISGATIYDLFPTALYLLGLPVPRDVPGKVLSGALDPAFVAAHPARSIDSYEGRWAPRVAGRAKAGAGLDDEEIEKLRALGYIQ